MRTKLFKIAHAIKGNFATFADALRHAWKVIRIYMKMRSHNVKFAYIKKDGSLRNAIGTLNVDYERKTDRETNYSLLTYFDVEANGWRSASINSLIF